MAGRPKLSDEKKTLILERLRANISVEDIANELQVSERTVLRYKKCLPPAPEKLGEQEEDPQLNYNYTIKFTKREEVFVKKLSDDIILYEDTEEGWIYHLDKGDYRLKQSGMWWTAIVYPESAPEGWIDRLRAQGFGVAISPLHDKDTWGHDSPAVIDPETGEIIIEAGAKYKQGDRKKAHWHIILTVDVRTGFREINNLVQSICHCPYIQKCRSLKNAYEYFLHKNHPNKYQNYDPEEIQTYNNFHIAPNKYEQAVLADEMAVIIKEQDITEWWQCVEYFSGTPEMTLILMTRTAYFQGYVKSRYYNKHPNTIKYTEVKQVERFSCEPSDDEV